MEKRKGRIENLKKISLLLEAGTAADSMDLTTHPIRLECIFGIGPEGLAPFEFELAAVTAVVGEKC